MAEQLETANASFAALDLDWLGWFNHPGADWQAVRNENLECVISNYERVGVDHLILAGSVFDRSELAAIQAAVPAELIVVRVEVALDLIESRLASDPGSERPQNLITTKRWLAEGVGLGLAAMSIDNSGHLPNVARELIRRLGW